MDLREETIAILNKYGLRANKKLGQNFLINESIIYDIVKKANVTKEDVVIEIGPGLGSLTKELINNAKKVIAIELDPNMIDILKSRFGIFDNFEVIYGDVLKIDLEELIKGYDSVKVVANLPYYITTPIIMKLLEDKLKIKSITVMVQKEVGERICATHKDKEYGAITVGETSYGKGTVQELLDLDDDVEYKITTKKWLTPKGNWINKKGVSVDVEVSLSEEYIENPSEDNDNQLIKAFTDAGYTKK